MKVEQESKFDSSMGGWSIVPPANRSRTTSRYSCCGPRTGTRYMPSWLIARTARAIQTTMTQLMRALGNS